AKSGSRGTRADQGVRPTIYAGFPVSGKLYDIGLIACQCHLVFIVARTRACRADTLPLTTAQVVVPWLVALETFPSGIAPRSCRRLGRRYCATCVAGEAPSSRPKSADHELIIRIKSLILKLPHHFSKP